MKVLIGVDGSSNSFAAVEFVGRLLSVERDELVLLFAAPAMAFDDDRLDPAVEQRARLALSHAVLEAALERLPQAWKERAQQRHPSGSASTALLDAIEADKAELVAVGFRGTSGILEDFVLGSVSRTIVHSAKVPALIVKSKGRTESPAKQSPGGAAQGLHVLVACDDSHILEPAPDLLKRFSWPTETRGFVLTAVQPMTTTVLPAWVEVKRDPDVAAMADAWQQEHREHLQNARGNLERFRAKLPPCFAAQEPIVVEGRPAEGILAQIHRQEIDLAVLGSRDHGSFKRLLLGSTSEQVLRESPCSVLIVR